MFSSLTGSPFEMSSITPHDHPNIPRTRSTTGTATTGSVDGYSYSSSYTSDSMSFSPNLSDALVLISQLQRMHSTKRSTPILWTATSASSLSQWKSPKRLRNYCR